MSAKLTVLFERLTDGQHFEVVNQTARAVIALHDAGDEGVTALEVASWAYRFAAYTFELRRKCGLEIETLHEVHSGGWHGRHVLRTPVRIVLVERREREAAA